VDAATAEGEEVRYCGMCGEALAPDALPPVFMLAKAEQSSIDARLGKVRELVASGEITSQEFEAAQDVIGRIKMASVVGKPVTRQDALRVLFRAYAAGVHPGDLIRKESTK
jgi:hypothetical protein